MKSIRIIASFVLLFVSLAAAPALSSAATAEDTAMGLFKKFNEIETAYRSRQWTAAEQALEDISKDFKAFEPMVAGKVDAKVLSKFPAAAEALKTKLSVRNPEEIEKPYMELQISLLDIMEGLKYPNPPALMIVDLYVSEALESLGKGLLYNVSEEMEEIDALKDRAKKEASKAGLNSASIKKLFELAEDTEELIGKKKAPAAKAKLEEMSALLKKTLK